MAWVQVLELCQKGSLDGTGADCPGLVGDLFGYERLVQAGTESEVLVPGQQAWFVGRFGTQIQESRTGFEVYSEPQIELVDPVVAGFFVFQMEPPQVLELEWAARTTQMQSECLILGGLRDFVSLPGFWDLVSLVGFGDQMSLAVFGDLLSLVGFGGLMSLAVFGDLLSQVEFGNLMSLAVEIYRPQVEVGTGQQADSEVVVLVLAGQKADFYWFCFHQL